MEIIHGTSTTAAEYVHGVCMSDTDMAISWNGRGALCRQGGPSSCVKIKQVSITQVAGPVMSPIKDH